MPRFRTRPRFRSDNSCQRANALCQRVSQRSSSPPTKCVTRVTPFKTTEASLPYFFKSLCPPSWLSSRLSSPSLSSTVSSWRPSGYLRSYSWFGLLMIRVPYDCLKSSNLAKPACASRVSFYHVWDKDHRQLYSIESEKRRHPLSRSREIPFMTSEGETGKRRRMWPSGLTGRWMRCVLTARALRARGRGDGAWDKWKGSCQRRHDHSVHAPGRRWVLRGLDRVGKGGLVDRQLTSALDGRRTGGRALRWVFRGKRSVQQPV